MDFKLFLDFNSLEQINCIKNGGKILISFLYSLC